MTDEGGCGLNIDTQQEVAYNMKTVRPMIEVLGTHDYISCLNPGNYLMS